MERELKSVVWDKWLNSEIDSVTLFFSHDTAECLVDMYDVPENELYDIQYSSRESNGEIVYLEIVNPSVYAKAKHPILSDFTFNVDGKEETLPYFIKRIA